MKLVDRIEMILKQDKNWIDGNVIIRSNVESNKWTDEEGQAARELLLKACMIGNKEVMEAYANKVYAYFNGGVTNE